MCSWDGTTEWGRVYFFHFCHAGFCIFYCVDHLLGCFSVHFLVKNWVHSAVKERLSYLLFGGSFFSLSGMYSLGYCWCARFFHSSPFPKVSVS